MRVAISADSNNGLDSVVSPHFGRCPYYVLVDVDGREVSEVSAVENPCYGQHRPGEVPGFIQSQGADVMLAGGMGRRAVGFFQQYGIQAVTGASGTVRQALEQYLDGALRGAEPCRESVAHEHQDASQNDGTYEKDEVERLHEEIEMLQQHLGVAMERLDNLAT